MCVCVCVRACVCARARAFSSGKLLAFSMLHSGSVFQLVLSEVAMTWKLARY